MYFDWKFWKLATAPFRTAVKSWDLPSTLLLIPTTLDEHWYNCRTYYLLIYSEVTSEETLSDLCVYHYSFWEHCPRNCWNIYTVCFWMFRLRWLNDLCFWCTLYSYHRCFVRYKYTSSSTIANEMVGYVRALEQKVQIKPNTWYTFVWCCMMSWLFWKITKNGLMAGRIMYRCVATCCFGDRTL